jgi:dihydrodipicolinate synthase/N-acetylneuraminate lyase
MARTWEGIFCALWTPTDDRGRILDSALRDNIEFLKKYPLRGLLVLGSTGQFPFLDIDCRRRMIETVASCAGNLELIVNVSDIRPQAVAELARVSKQTGASAISLLPPYFYPVAQEDLQEFFVRAAEPAQLPLFLYNFPERTGNRIDLETISAVADRVHLAGVKQSGQEFDYHKDLAQLGQQRGFVVLTGADTRLPEALPLGVSGCVSGLANAVPDLVLAAYSAARNGAGNDRRLIELSRLTQSLRFPLDVAAAMRARGLGIGAYKGTVSKATEELLEKASAEIRTLFSSADFEAAPSFD